jgi:hypothetical protein
MQLSASKLSNAVAERILPIVDNVLVFFDSF